MALTAGATLPDIGTLILLWMVVGDSVGAGTVPARLAQQWL